MKHTTFQLPYPALVTADNGRFDEALIALAADGQPSACLWTTAKGLVVPRTYLRSEQFTTVSKQFKHAGWPISVRQSGGGIVPQGPGVLNLSLAYAVNGKPLDHADAAYLLLCEIISLALRQHGISTRTQAVEGSFCDGRYNLATGPHDDPRKVAGTAQVWRRHSKPEPGSAPLQIVLVHAIVLAACDIVTITHQANRLEHALGNNKRYLAERAMSLHECGNHSLTPFDFVASLQASLLRQVTLTAAPVAATPA